MVTSVVTTSGNTTCMDFSTNQWHGYVGGSTPYGLWVDGPLHPWRDANGTPTFISCHSEGYRFNVVYDWHNGNTWTNWNAGVHWNSPVTPMKGIMPTVTGSCPLSPAVPSLLPSLIMNSINRLPRLVGFRFQFQRLWVQYTLGQCNRLCALDQ